MRRNTIQRALVLEAVNKLKCPATAEEIYSLIAKEHPSISKVTVYRNLYHLAESGEIRRMEVPGGADRFDHRPFDHYHVRCLQCGRVFDVDMDYIDDLQQNIRDKHGFEFSGYDLMFRGICPECQKKQSPAGEGNRG